MKQDILLSMAVMMVLLAIAIGMVYIITEKFSELSKIKETQTQIIEDIETTEVKKAEPMIEITSIKSLSDIIVKEGDAPDFPQYAIVNYSNGERKELPIKWQEFSPNDIGVFTVYGIIEELNQEISCNVEVLSKRLFSFDIIRDDTFIANKIIVNNSDYVVPDDIADKIYNIIDENNIVTGFYAISLKDYTTIGYNAYLSFHTASTVKAPYALYLMKEINKGEKSLDDRFAYQEKHWEKSSGQIKLFPYGTEFTINDILYYMIHISDNTAYYMIKDYCKYPGYNEMLEELGCQQWMSDWVNWGMFTPHDLAVIWNEIYNFSFECEEGDILLNLLIDAKYNFIKEALNDYTKVAHKSGFNDNGYHDAAIIYGDSSKKESTDDYIVVIMTQTVTRAKNKVYLSELAQAIDVLMRDLAKN